MSTISIAEAKASLAEVIHRLIPGEGLVITENDLPVARLTAISNDVPRPVLGRCTGMLIIDEEDDDHLQDFGEYMR